MISCTTSVFLVWRSLALPSVSVPLLLLDPLLHQILPIKHLSLEPTPQLQRDIWVSNAHYAGNPGQDTGTGLGRKLESC